MALEFEWDAGKAAENIRKHGVSFEEVLSVFTDILSVTIPDPDHSNQESRWLQLGMSGRGRLLVVSFTERDGHLRIISARVATRSERHDYEEGK